MRPHHQHAAPNTRRRANGRFGRCASLLLRCTRAVLSRECDRTCREARSVGRDTRSRADKAASAMCVTWDRALLSRCTTVKLKTHNTTQNQLNNTTRAKQPSTAKGQPSKQQDTLVPSKQPLLQSKSQSWTVWFVEIAQNNDGLF